MPVVVMLTMRAAEGRYGELAETIKAILPDTAARPGARLIRAAGNPSTGTITLYEEWDRIESQQAYLAWRTERGDIATLAAMLREPPQVEQLALLF
jgi:quinol monooxygenase YgiN